MAKRVFNFNAGPSTLPLDVLKIVQEELLDYRGSGMSIMESSHRSPEFDAINNEAMALVKEVLGLGDNFHVMFLTGGASSQFAMIPMNFLGPDQVAAYVDTGTWSTKAIKECEIQGKMHLAASTKEAGFTHVPAPADISYPDNSAYLHITSNNTIKGTQYHQFPDTGNIPLICDMSSDIASRKIDYSQFSYIYAGAQKNLGPSGVTLGIIRDDLLARGKEGLPTMLTYKTHVDKKSLFNTPPAFGIYVMKLVLEWIKGQGGLEAVEKVNRAKKDILYGLMDEQSDFFKGTAKPDSRSWMNVTMRLPDEDMEKAFIAEAKEAGFVGIKGHRSVGGIRFSIYNAMPLEGVEKAAEFMKAFRKKH